MSQHISIVRIPVRGAPPTSADESETSAKSNNRRRQKSLVVELSALSGTDSDLNLKPDSRPEQWDLASNFPYEERRGKVSARSGSGSGQKWPLLESSDNALDSHRAGQIEQVAQSFSSNTTTDKRMPWLVHRRAPTLIPSTTTKIPSTPSTSRSPQTACKLSERSVEAHKRSELCYWFRISEQLRGKINGSLVRTKASSSARRERLVEAELHVFKLLPELLLNTRDQAYFAKNSNGVSTTMGSNNIHDSHSEWKELKTGSGARTLNWPSSLMVNGSSLHGEREEILEEGGGEAPQEMERGEARRGIVKENEQERDEKEMGDARRNLEERARQMSDGYTQAKNSEPVRMRSQHTNSLYHLKTNLLEVSLYQILPKKSQSSYRYNAQTSSNTSTRSGALISKLTSNKETGISSEYPLRLLDIRRIDLDSSGWETFYVKRAVEDWISDASSNLGLVIKAKSMFEEPIKIGLIRFADRYDHREVGVSRKKHEIGVQERDSNQYRQAQIGSENKRGEGKGKGKKGGKESETGGDRASRKRREQQDFDSSHQPILVIYTSVSPSEN